jgi:hypothetical protein
MNMTRRLVQAQLERVLQGSPPAGTDDLEALLSGLA